MKRLFLFVPLLLLGGCVSFGPKPAKTLLTLTASTPAVAGTSRTSAPGNTIIILTPTAPAAIGTLRIPVYDGPATLAYVRDAAWNEAPARLFQRILSETVTVRTSLLVLDPRQFGTDPGIRLSGQLQQFGVDPGAMQAVVVFDAQVTRTPGHVEQRRFEARAPLAAVEGNAVGVALNHAANDVAGQIAEWVKG